MTAGSRPSAEVPGWRDLRHGGLLLDGQRLAELAPCAPDALDDWTEHQLRRRASDDPSAFVKFVLEDVCGFGPGTGTWSRGSKVASTWGRRGPTGDVVKPHQLWQGPQGAHLPVFMEPGRRVGIGKGRRKVSQALGWLRAGNDHLALVTNGKQWRLLFAGLDFEAWCEWDVDLWFQEGKPTLQVDALRTLLQPKLWTPESDAAVPPLLQAIRDTRKGQAELSETLGERVREAVEILIQGHGEALKDLNKDQSADVDPPDIYRAACRVVMRLVVILFAEARDLLPRDNPVYHASYGLNGLMERLQSAAGRYSLSGRFSAWPQVLALFNLVRDGSHLPQMPVRDYGGELFEAGRPDSDDGLSRALAVFETACFKQAVLPDEDVRRMLERMTRTRTRIRQGRGGTWVTVPVDFSDLSSDYIGILYEGLLDYELKTAAPDEPVIFLAAGNYPALPLSRLEAMDDKALKTLFSNLKKDVAEEEEHEEPEHPTIDGEGGADDVEDDVGRVLGTPNETLPDSNDLGNDPRLANRTRAEAWARRAAQVAGLVRKRRGKHKRERQQKTDLAQSARKLVARDVLPGEWYLVRWGGTRKGAGSFYTRPGLAVPTVQRTLRPLAYDPPLGDEGKPNHHAPAVEWTPKLPEQILDLKVCDPACGSGAFALSALRFLTDALFASVQHHGRIEPQGERTLVRLLGAPTGHERHVERLGDELIPCPPDHDDFERRLRAVLRRYVVERCIYAVDIDALAIELCRLSLWIETMDRGLPFGFLDHKIKCGDSLVGAWFDQFAHYPVMAWKNREGGDKNHGNGVHFEKGARTKAIKEFVQDDLKPDLASFLGEPDLFLGDYLKHHDKAHGAALAVLEKMHALPVQDATERARLYRNEFVGSPEWLSLKEAMDLWCACWFWPADKLDCAPLPKTFANPSQETRAEVRRVAAATKCFHWELEFPDVFREAECGFDAVLGNPPWDIAKPNSQEFFSNIDPLYRSYGKQEAIKMQTSYFDASSSGETDERRWIDYNAYFRSRSNYVKYVARPFGDPTTEDKSTDRFSIQRGNANAQLHNSWRRARSGHSTGFADVRHPYRWQGPADLNLYKQFLEVSHALLKPGGRLGLIVPSGLYSDYGTTPMRTLFLEHCNWEWLFGIENRNKVFPIHRSYKFNPVVLQKGGSTKAIHTAFMRRDLDDWDRAESMAIPYSRAQVTQFSPETRTLLEIQSKRDLETLEKMYANGVLLADDGPGGWGVEWITEFNITTDSKLFSPRPQWESLGYRPDEYSRWLRGPWHPIDDLWKVIGVGPDQLRVCCAPAPYDRLSVPRGMLPEGIILAREADAWLREEEVNGMAVPLYEGRMIGQYDYSQKCWISGKGRSAVWHEIPWNNKRLEPQYLMDHDIYINSPKSKPISKTAYMRISSSTNTRTVISCHVHRQPACDSVFFYAPVGGDRLARSLVVSSIFCTLAFDSAVRVRMAGLNLNEFIMREAIMPARDDAMERLILGLSASMQLIGPLFATETLQLGRPLGVQCAVTPKSRLRHAVVIDALVAYWMGLSSSDLRILLADCDRGRDALPGDANPKGFWRVDKERAPELRQTVLTRVALHDLETSIRECNGDRDMGMQNFAKNHGEGWTIPETLCLADYNMGHDERAKHPQPVASRLGPDFYDWQLVQKSEDAWRECHLHARNLLGPDEYARFLKDLLERHHRQERIDVMSADTDYTRSVVGGRGLLDHADTHTQEPLARAAEPRTRYPSDLFGTDDPS